jgi:hypothetical protein
MQLDGRRTCIFNPPLTWNGNIGEEIPWDWMNWAQWKLKEEPWSRYDPLTNYPWCRHKRNHQLKLHISWRFTYKFCQTSKLCMHTNPVWRRYYLWFIINNINPQNLSAPFLVGLARFDFLLYHLT